MNAAPASRAVLLLIAYIGFVSLGLPDTLIGVAWPSVREAFGLPLGGVGIVFLATGTGYFLSSFFTGQLLRLVGIGILLAVSSALVAFSGFGFALAPLYAVFVLCALIHGLGSGAIDAGLNHYVANHFSARHMNWLHACYSFGATIGPLIMMGAITWSGSWRTGYATMGGILLSLALLFSATQRLWGKDEPTSAEHHLKPGGHMKAALRNPAARLQIALFFVYTGLEVTLGQWCFTVLTESRAVRAETAGIWVTIYWGSIGVGRVLFGFVVERLGIDRLLRYSTVGAMIGAGLFALDGSGPAAFAGLALAGLALAPIYPCMMTRTPERLGKDLAAHAIGFQVSGGMIGAAVLPAIAGILAQGYGLENVTLAAFAFAGILVLLHEILLRRWSGRSFGPARA